MTSPLKFGQCGDFSPIRVTLMLYHPMWDGSIVIPAEDDVAGRRVVHVWCELEEYSFTAILLWTNHLLRYNILSNLTILNLTSLLKIFQYGQL